MFGRRSRLSAGRAPELRQYPRRATACFGRRSAQTATAERVRVRRRDRLARDARGARKRSGSDLPATPAMPGRWASVRWLRAWARACTPAVPREHSLAVTAMQRRRAGAVESQQPGRWAIVISQHGQTAVVKATGPHAVAGPGGCMGAGDPGRVFPRSIAAVRRLFRLLGGCRRTAPSAPDAGSDVGGEPRNAAGPSHSSPFRSLSGAFSRPFVGIRRPLDRLLVQFA
jgi:hypothetical protein